MRFYVIISLLFIKPNFKNTVVCFQKQTSTSLEILFILSFAVEITLLKTVFGGNVAIKTYLCMLFLHISVTVLAGHKLSR